METQIGIKDMRSLITSALDYLRKEELEFMLEGLEKMREITDDKKSIIDADIIRIRQAIQRKSA